VAKAKNVPTKARLARELGCSYYTLVTRYWNLPGRPKDNSPGSARYNVQAYRNWIGSFKFAHNFGSGHNGNDGYPLNEREKARIEKTNVEIERERFKLDVERGKYELKANVYERQLQNVSSTFRELDKAFKHELPPRLEGESAGAIAKICGRKLDELRERLAHSFESNGSTIS
jgi:hypothetical protein